MDFSYQHLRLWLLEHRLWPASRLGRMAWYVLATDGFLFVLQGLLRSLRSTWAASLDGWVSFLTFIAAVLFVILGYRWLKSRLLWRLRNRLIVTYIFIGVIPVVLLVVLALGSFYLFAGQFATFVVTTGLKSELDSLEAANAAIAHELAARLERGERAEAAALAGLRQTDKAWADREVYSWLNGRLVLNSTPAGPAAQPPILPSFFKDSFRNVVRDHGRLFLRAVETVPLSNGRLVILSSEPLDQHLLADLAANLGQVALYATGLNLRKVDQPKSGISVSGADNAGQRGASLSVGKPDGEYVLDTGDKPLTPTYSAGSVPPANTPLDHLVTFPTSVLVVNWETGDTSSPAAISVQTRFSKLYERLFGALGDFAPAVEFVLLFVLIVFAVIEVLALVIGAGLTRSITKAVAQLYNATKHINRADFSHRIPVKTNDQLATLAHSFNSMTASIEALVLEQKEKQRLENELVIAQEVQSQLFPKEIVQLESLEVHGFCRPARTVSGDYYDFVSVNSGQLMLAAGDVSGKGISAALLMATIHSAVRAFSLESQPVREQVAVGASTASGVVMASGIAGSELSPAALLALLNHQLYESTPEEKYATLFLGIYDPGSRRLTYSNGGHLPPIILGRNGALQRLTTGGTVVGLLDNMSFVESSVTLEPGDLFLAYSDGVTEPENEFGEFGERRLVDLVRENADLPLVRITEAVTAAVDDWIGPHEQPDDVTLVLARAR